MIPIIKRWWNKNKNPPATILMRQHQLRKVETAATAVLISSSGHQPRRQNHFRPFLDAFLTCSITRQRREWGVAMMLLTRSSHTMHWDRGIPLNLRWIKSVSLFNYPEIFLLDIDISLIFLSFFHVTCTANLLYLWQTWQCRHLSYPSSKRTHRSGRLYW